jgi:ElaB/YqjD/DUF883 family membrane-anchored ribosome-binding protein
MATNKAEAPKELRLDEIGGEVARVLKDALYVSVGFGVLAVQKAQEQRQELQKALGRRVDSGKVEWDKVAERFDAQLKGMEERLDTLEQRVEEMLDQVQEKLPEQVADLMAKARTAVKDAREQVTELVKREDKAA